MKLSEKLKRRGFVEQFTDEKIFDKIDNETITCYVGFDPTSDSLHVGNLVPIMLLRWFEEYNHKVIALVGGGTALIGDPSGKTEMRKMLTKEKIDSNINGIKNNLKNFLDIPNKTQLLNNYDWLGGLEYIDFLRDIGSLFSVNRMLSAESYKIRLEKGLSFLEFNYQILQAFDFLRLFEKEGCTLELGGSDQWGNIVAGMDLIRRKHQKESYGLTVPLIQTASGQKMGKSEGNAVWLNGNKLNPYDYYQFWINTDDRDVKRFLLLYTMLEEDYIDELTNVEGHHLNKAKEVLAYEATKLCHGEEEAKKAVKGAKIFKGVIDETTKDHLPSIEINKSEIEDKPVFLIFKKVGLCNSNSDAKRLIKGGGAYIENKKVEKFDDTLNSAIINKNEIILRAGKKKYMRVIIK